MNDDFLELGVNEALEVRNEASDAREDGLDTGQELVVNESGVAPSYRPRFVRGPDIPRWEMILSSDPFTDDLEALSSIFQSQDYSVEAHVDRPSFRDVEYDMKSKPDFLGLMIANDYDEFMGEVSHPVFHELSESDRVRPEGAQTELSFGSYSNTSELGLDLDNLDVHIPTFSSYDSSVLESFSSWRGNEYDPDFQDQGIDDVDYVVNR